MARLSRERIERTNAVLAEPDAFEIMLDHVSEGGTLAEWCSRRDIKFRTVREWIEFDPERKKAFVLATNSRESFLQDAVLATLRDLNAADLTALLTEDGSMKPLKDIPPQFRRLISSLETRTKVTEEGDTETFHRVKSLTPDKGADMLGKHLGMYKEKMEVTGKDGAPLEMGPAFVDLATVLLDKVRGVKPTSDQVPAP